MYTFIANTMCTLDICRVRLLLILCIWTNSNSNWTLKHIISTIYADSKAHQSLAVCKTQNPGMVWLSTVEQPGNLETKVAMQIIGFNSESAYIRQFGHF